MRSHDMTGEAKTGNRMLKLVKDDITWMKEKYGFNLIAWCTDDAPDNKKMRRLLTSFIPWIVVIVCWAHQIDLVVGDLLSLRTEFTSVVRQALDIIIWFNNHGLPLDLLRHEQEQTYGKSWALFLPADTRWLGHYLATARVLKIEQALRTCVIRHREELFRCAGPRLQQKRKAQATLEPISDPEFWSKLK